MSIPRTYLSIFVVILAVSSIGCARWRPFSRLPLPVEQAEPSSAPIEQLSPSTGSRFGFRRMQLGQDGSVQGAARPVQGAAHIESAPAVEPQLPAPAEEMKSTTLPSLAGSRKLEGPLALARLTEKKGDPRQAAAMYHEFLKTHPDNQLCYHRLAILAAKETKYDEAERYFQQAMRMAPASTELISDYGYCLFRQNKLAEAEKYLLQALSREPTNQKVNNNLGLVYGAMGDYPKSLGFFRKVLDDGEAYANLGFVYSQQGDLEKSREEYLRALTLDNTLKNAAEALAQVDKQYKVSEAEMTRVKQEIEGVEPETRIADNEDVIDLPFPGDETEAEDGHQAGLLTQGSQARQAAVTPIESPVALPKQAVESATEIPLHDDTPITTATSMFKAETPNDELQSHGLAEEVAPAKDDLPTLRIRTISTDRDQQSHTTEHSSAVRNENASAPKLPTTTSPVGSDSPRFSIRQSANSEAEAESADDSVASIFVAEQEDAVETGTIANESWNVRLKPTTSPTTTQQPAAGSDTYPRRPLQSLPSRTSSLDVSSRTSLGITKRLPTVDSSHQRPNPVDRAQTATERHAAAVARMSSLPSWTRPHVANQTYPSTATPAGNQAQQSMGSVHSGVGNAHQATPNAAGNSSSVPVLTPSQIQGSQPTSHGPMSRFGGRLFR